VVKHVMRTAQQQRDQEPVVTTFVVTLPRHAGALEVARGGDRWSGCEWPFTVNGQ
jgi:hypothetical protein